MASDTKNSRTEMALTFIVHLCREMLENGANLERINISVRRICRCYHLKESSVFYGGSVISIGITDEKGNYYVRQESVPYTGIHLCKLAKLNLLVHDIINKKPPVDTLMDMLYEALMVASYSNIVQLLGYILAMISLGRIFGGTWTDLLVIGLNTVVLYFMTMIFSRGKLNRIISNVIAMLFCGLSAILFARVGIVRNISAIIITNAFYLIPGIPMVNAVRNIFCGNEMNGIIEMVKVLLEVVTIVSGLYIASLLFGADAMALF